MLKAAHDVEARAKVAIQTGAKTGRMYGRHQASAPGEAPATDTGHLVNSIHVDAGPGELAAEVVVGAEYGAYLEFGTTDMAPRPFLGPAVEAARPGFVAAVETELNRG